MQTPATTGTGAHAELFVRDPGGKLLAMIDTTGGPVGENRYYLTDDQNSVMATATRCSCRARRRKPRCWSASSGRAGTRTTDSGWSRDSA